MSKTGQDIRDAIAALPNGHGTVILDADIYTLFETLIIPEGVYVRGQGEWATWLHRGIGANCDMVLIGNTEFPYQKYCGLSGVRLHGNPKNNSEGSGLIISYTWHCRVEGVRIQDQPDWGLKVLRSYWASIRDMHVRHCTKGVLVGAGGDPTLYSNSNELSNVHVEGGPQSERGIFIANGNSTLLDKCDTSGCEIGVLIETVEGGSCCERNTLIAHHFEANEIGIANRQGPIPGEWRNYLIAPRFDNNEQDIVDETGTLQVFI